MNPIIVAAIVNVNMGLGHNGLTLIASKMGYKLGKLPEGGLLLFINSARDKLKMLDSSGTILGYVKMPKGRRLPLEAVQFIPKTFSSDGKIDIDKAIAEFVNKKITDRTSVKKKLELCDGY